MGTLISNIGNKEFRWTFNNDGSIFEGKDAIDVDIRKISRNRYSILLNGRSYQAVIARKKFSYTILINGITYDVEVESSAKKLIKLRNGAMTVDRAHFELRSPMPGMVVRCEVDEGERIMAGDGLVILEAMKMENEIRAPRDGTIKKIHVQDKQIVDKGALLITME